MTTSAIEKCERGHECAAKCLQVQLMRTSRTKWPERARCPPASNWHPSWGGEREERQRQPKNWKPHGRVAKRRRHRDVPRNPASSDSDAEHVLCSAFIPERHASWPSRHPWESNASKLSFVVWAIPPVAKVIGSCNAVLYVHSFLQHADATVMMDTEILYDGPHRNPTIERPMYAELQWLFAQVISSLMGSRCFDLAGKTEFQTHSLAYPTHSFHALQLRADHLSRDGTMSVSEPASMMVMCNARQVKYMGVLSDVVPSDVHAAFEARAP